MLNLNINYWIPALLLLLLSQACPVSASAAACPDLRGRRWRCQLSPVVGASASDNAEDFSNDDEETTDVGVFCPQAASVFTQPAGPAYARLQMNNGSRVRFDTRSEMHTRVHVSKF